jgi:hypothetical protein
LGVLLWLGWCSWFVEIVLFKESRIYYFFLILISIKYLWLGVACLADPYKELGLICVSPLGIIILWEFNNYLAFLVDVEAIEFVT